MRIAIVGTGYVADLYMKTLGAHPELQLAGVLDKEHEQSSRFAQFHSVRRYDALEQLLNDDTVDIVLNLTNPHSHFEVSKQCLEAGKNVYSEKPLAMDFGDAQILVEMAEQKNLIISSAPCSLLGETAQTIGKALREQAIGPVRLVYAEMDDGPVPQMRYKKWISNSGVPWPWKDEFEIGCTLEHAGYCLTWLAGFFGPAETVTAFSSVLIPDKNTEAPLDAEAPDFSVACISFSSGVVARLTCSIVAPHNHRFLIVGDKGVLGTRDNWDYRSPVYIRRWVTIRRRTFLSPLRRRYPLAGRSTPRVTYRGGSRMDFCRGVSEMAAAISEKRPCRLSSRFSLHVTELALAISKAQENSSTYRLSSSFDPVDPMPWAKSRS